MANGAGDAYPLRRQDVRLELEGLIQKTLELSGGTGLISIEFNFKGGKALSWRLVGESARRDLTQESG